MKVIAHRGASAYAPENTMPAFELAFRQGAHGIELDVQRTADGKIVVIHDHTIDRTSNGRGPVASHTLGDLLKLDFGRWFGGSYAAVKIPLLDEVINYVSGKDIILNIELKIDPPAYDRKMVGLVAELIPEALLERVIISSFDHGALADIKGFRPGIVTAPLYECRISRVWKYAKQIGAGYIHPAHGSLVREDIMGCKLNNIGVNAWTVDTDADIRRMLDIGADAVITNKPDAALAIAR